MRVQLALNTSVAALKAMAEPTRLRLLVLLASGELSVKDLTGILGQSQPRISRHLKLLAEAGLVERAPEGSWVYFRLAEGGEGGALARLVLEAVDRGDAVLVRDRRRAEALREERERAAQAYFQAHAGEWDSIRALHVAEAEVEAAVAAALGPGPFDLLVDLGTGTGRMLELLRDRYRRGLGIDLSPAMLAYARAKLERTRAAPRPGAAGRHLRSAARRSGRRCRGDAPGAALPERSAARGARGGARAGAGRAPADRRFRAARAGVPARAVRARAARASRTAGRAVAGRQRPARSWSGATWRPKADARRAAGKLTVSVWVASRPPSAAATAHDVDERKLERIS